MGCISYWGAMGWTGRPVSSPEPTTQCRWDCGHFISVEITPSTLWSGCKKGYRQLCFLNTLYCETGLVLWRNGFVNKYVWNLQPALPSCSHCGLTHEGLRTPSVRKSALLIWLFVSQTGPLLHLLPPLLPWGRPPCVVVDFCFVEHDFEYSASHTAPE